MKTNPSPGKEKQKGQKAGAKLDKEHSSEMTASEFTLLVAKNAVNFGIHDYDIGSGAIQWDERVREIWGVGPDIPITHEVFMSGVHPEDRASVQSAVDQALDPSGNGEYYAEFRVVSLDQGIMRWIAATGHVFFDQGKPSRLIGTVQDISERRKTEEALRLVNERYDMAQVAAGAGVWDWNIITGKIEWTPRMFDLFGLDPENSIASFEAWTKVLHPEDRDEAVSRIDQALKSHSLLSNEYRVVHPDGRVHWINALGRGIYDDQGYPVRMMGICLDITERKQAQADLRKKKAKMDSIFRAAPTGIGVVSNRILVEVNQRICEMTGYSREELVGKSSRMLYPTQEDFEFVGNEKYRQIALQGTGSVETKWRRKDGTTMDIILSSSPVDQGNLSAGVTFTALDITDRKRAEKDLERYREHLEELVKDRTIELEEKNKKLGEEIAERKRIEEEKHKVEAQLLQAQKIEALGNFAGGIAHDLNNILYPMVINTETLLDEAPPGTQAHEMLSQTLDAAYRQRDLIKQILSFSRRNVQKLSPIEVTPLLEHTLRFIRSTLPSTIEMRRSINAPEDTIMGDSTQIQQVIMNLCKNAADAMESQKGTIEVSLSNVHIDGYPAGSDIKPGEYLELVVQDNGHGIPPDVIDRIFDPFFTTKPVGKGSGMGLSVVYGIVTKLGGTITVTSHGGEGSRFTVYLPLHGYGSNTHTSRRKDQDTARKNILLVDDEDAIVTTLERALERMGYHVRASRNAQEALDLFCENPGAFDLVITDMTMPRMTGIELGKRIMEIRPDTSVILCTGFSDLINEKGAKDLGFSGLLIKPAGTSELRLAVSHALES